MNFSMGRGSGRLLPPLGFAGFVVGLPLLGVRASGRPVAPYLTLPPRPRGMTHAPFSWAAFSVGVLLLTAAVAPLVRHRLRWRARPAPRVARRFPGWGWLALGCGLVTWALA